MKSFLMKQKHLGYIYYNHNSQQVTNNITADRHISGLKLRECLGSPPNSQISASVLCLPMLDKLGNIILSIPEGTANGTTMIISCPNNCNSAEGILNGTGWYTEDSSVCKAAIHWGVMDTFGGNIEITIADNIGNFSEDFIIGTSRNGINSSNISYYSDISSRGFYVRKLLGSESFVHTVNNGMQESLSEECTYVEALIPPENKFNGPQDITASTIALSLSDTQYAYIVDTNNNIIREMSAVCSIPCENGGKCSGIDLCECPSGWTGIDCSIPVCSVTCRGRQVCVAPETCDCIPGYTGSDCLTPLCVQNCANNGTCIAPDTCLCSYGWFDPNCTTPVCEMTCGNGANCTGPNLCACREGWVGQDCRIPSCSQVCQNGGKCVAPNTCLCTAGWSGFDCSTPICTQGTFVPYPQNLSTISFWEEYLPCGYYDWCHATSGFDCSHRPSSVVSLDESTASIQRVQCFLIELPAYTITNFQNLLSSGEISKYARFSGSYVFDSHDDGNDWSAITIPSNEHTGPWTYSTDRQIALVEKRIVKQGTYTCANNGICSAPAKCLCSDGWIGFDCRIPVCEQGYYIPEYMFGSDPHQPFYNPVYNLTIENITDDLVIRTVLKDGNETYKFKNNGLQGAYSCSIRGITLWEKPATIGPNASGSYIHEHPNYYSRYMDKTLSADGVYHTFWENMYWPPVHTLTTPLLDNATYGYERGGVWIREEINIWEKGTCEMLYSRRCPKLKGPPLDLETNTALFAVSNTDLSYRVRSTYTNDKEYNIGVLPPNDISECVDFVIRGCFNNGTCVAPNKCRCAKGWTGYDCSIPICQQTCANNGNCTLPNICTCERGWTGRDCTIPMCAQECRNNGTCIAPDMCECMTWPNKWVIEDGLGDTIFQLPSGTPQLTGYTGYDCNTPICVQAEKFLLNTDVDPTALRGHGPNNTLECSTYRCPQYDQEIVFNDGYYFQSGCAVVKPVNVVKTPLSFSTQIENIILWNDSLNVNRTSTNLCGRLTWEEGDFITGRNIRTNYRNISKTSNGSWIEYVADPGEGVYMCYNKGSCLFPDTCSCGDGYTGFDCSTPLCRFFSSDGSITGCQENSYCAIKNVCECIQTDSVLYQRYPNAPRGKTGYIGTDCSIPICVQGFFDPSCNENITGTEGCYRCPNGGTCVSPDLCECPEGWEGYDCTTPICQLTATETIKKQLFTLVESKIYDFEMDPCGNNGGRWEQKVFNGVLMGQGNCTLPGLCTCLCRERYNKKICSNTGKECRKPWSDPYNRAIPEGYVYGTGDCYDGFQGVENSKGQFLSCHLQIYIPTTWERYSQSFTAILSVAGVLGFIIYWQIRKRVKRQQLITKAERRRSKRLSEDDPLHPKGSAFIHK